MGNGAKHTGSSALFPRLRGSGRLSLIGLDVGTRLVKAIQLESTRSGLRVVAAAVLPRSASAVAGLVGAAPVSNAEAAELAEVLGRAGFAGHRLVLAAPSDRMFQSVLDLPPKSSAAPVAQLARLELARTQKCAPDSFELGFWELPLTGRGRGAQVMAVGLPHAHGAALVDAFDSAGLRVEALDVPACAIARACAPALPQPDKAGVTAVLDLGWGPASLTLLYRGAVVYGRVLADAGVGRLHEALIGRTDVDQEVADYLIREVGLAFQPLGTPADLEANAELSSTDAVPLRLPDEAVNVFENHVDALAGEMALSFSYAMQQYPEATVSHLSLVGGGAGIPGLARRLGAATGLPTRVVAPVAIATYDPSLASLCDTPLLTAAAGLAQFPEL